MERDHFIGKVQHFFSRFGYPPTTVDTKKADDEQRAWTFSLWDAVKAWDGNLIRAFDDTMDAFVAKHKGGRPTVRDVISKARTAAGGAPLEFDSAGNEVICGYPDWSKSRREDESRLASDRKLVAEDDCRGLCGLAMAEYVRARRMGMDPAAAREHAEDDRDRRGRETSSQREEVRGKIAAMCETLRGGPRLAQDEEEGGWEH